MMHDENSGKGMAKAVVPALAATTAGAFSVFGVMKWKQVPVDQPPLGGSSRLISKSLACSASSPLRLPAGCRKPSPIQEEELGNRMSIAPRDISVLKLKPKISVIQNLAGFSPTTHQATNE